MNRMSIYSSTPFFLKVSSVLVSLLNASVCLWIGYYCRILLLCLLTVLFYFAVYFSIVKVMSCGIVLFDVLLLILLITTILPMIMTVLVTDDDDDGDGD